MIDAALVSMLEPFSKASHQPGDQLHITSLRQGRRGRSFSGSNPFQGQGQFLAVDG